MVLRVCHLAIGLRGFSSISDQCLNSALEELQPTREDGELQRVHRGGRARLPAVPDVGVLAQRACPGAGCDRRCVRAAPMAARLSAPCAERQTPPKSPLTVSEMLDWLPTLGKGHAAALEQRARLRVAVNQEFAEPDTLIHAGDEVAVFPPVTGG